jgi:A/G-specific adenine glycosylase
VTAAARFAATLLTWWDDHGRHDLPWQQNTTPYSVWVSEIMLQQTQVATVERYFDRFMASFPNVAALANASLDDVLHHWSGLGYYSRARNLHKAAGLVVEQHAGVVPADLDELIALPGIGRSTAGAILSLACGQRQPILDGNVKRVLARFYAVEGWAGSSANLKILWELSEQCTPNERVGAYTQAIMDMGATLCTRSRPACESCPMQSGCQAFALNRVSAIPAAKPRKEKPRRAAVIVMARNEAGRVLLEKRPPSGIWGGLWSFPELSSLDEIDGWCASYLGRVPVKRQAWAEVSHSFSHFEFAMTPVEVAIEGAPDAVMEGDRWLWYNTRSPASIGLAAPVEKLLQRLDSMNNNSGEEQ